MSSLLEELHRREAAARSEVDELRREMAELHERLAQAEGRLSRLEITRETVGEILDETGADPPAAGHKRETDAEPDAAPEVSRFGDGSPIGVQMVPPWRQGLGVSVLPGAYQDLVEVLADAKGPLRAMQVAEAAGLSVDRSKVEGLRSKLKRLVERDWLTEDGPGRFTLPERQSDGAES
ncbi:hypothetical protein C8250_041405 [Streptomyces sp. So13.3]|uniref:hypothetical protein n=1 Tax=unclassified Streptomyces TaxID=2593676 RepID=UPI001105FD17|nr:MULTISPECIES: hypothetical protein [unclassified Streptomyces]NEA72581.1 hypothetical protein [Streptomyces sp. SID13588]QNA73114.1 hypothetical protein C8250_015380 [Streptomyces sp. So13.3]QNA77410.1 hypothetical protein C8250_041405 [Streptomyces sp. So13.3]